MPIKFLLIFLTLGLFVLAQETPTQPTAPVQRHPQSTMSNPAKENYYLINGTDGCPSEMTLLHKCRGIVLVPNENGLISGNQKFCDINRGQRITRLKSEVGYQELRSTVSKSDNIVQKVETTVYTKQGESLSLQAEDTVILDDTGKLLWEHSQNSQGFSCLYSR